MIQVFLGFRMLIHHHKKSQSNHCSAEKMQDPYFQRFNRKKGDGLIWCNEDHDNDR
jgi:hypothetical protein